MPEPPLTDRELRIVRGMIDNYENSRVVEAWFRLRWKTLATIVGILSAVAVTVAAIIEIIHTALGG